jgi:2-dehydro-3-deoxygalactonokinase
VHVVIAVDWGSSHFRVYRLNESYDTVGERRSNAGAAGLKPFQFRSEFLTEVGDWLCDGETRILMCGMVGSKSGWTEVPYVPLPAGIEEICRGVVSLNMPELDVRVVPGLMGSDVAGIIEVMRGEETEIMGAGRSTGGMLVLPGTHTKWVRLAGTKIASFSTYMRGELFGALRTGTMLAHSMAGEDDGSGFEKGVQRAQESGGVSHHLFGIRSSVLFGELRAESAVSYLSGLLIGHEVKDAIRETHSVHLIGEAPLCALYARAITICGGSATTEPEGAAIRGLIQIAKRLKWS